MNQDYNKYYGEEIAYTDYEGDTHALDANRCPKDGSELDAVDTSNGSIAGICPKCSYYTLEII